jgi:D-glycero-D-manno-heptose 1,7-bisphosphate phosphatase
VNAEPGGRRYVILDRDGTINFDRDHLSDPAELELIPGASRGLRRLQELGLGLVIVTNQSVVGRGMVDEAGLEAIHRRLLEMLGNEGVTIDGVYHCPHVEEDGCGCRKPEPELVWRAAHDLGFDPRRSFLVGDHLTDVEMGRSVGAATILVKTGHWTENAPADGGPDHVAADLEEAADIIRELIASEDRDELARPS